MTALPVQQAGQRLKDLLISQRLDPDRLELWEAWKAFKAFVRLPVRADDEEVLVEFWPFGDEDREAHVIMRRRLALRSDDDAAEPDGIDVVREIVVDVGFNFTLATFAQGLTLCDVDFPNFDAFVATVESSPAFQDAAGIESAGSVVYEMDGSE